MPRNSVRRRVVVVGGGVIGCATAYQLARAGFKVTLLERDAIAAHASGHNAGNLNPLHGTPPALLPFAQQAFRLQAEIRAELSTLGCAHYVASPMGRIFLGYDESERQELDKTAALFGDTPGFSSTWLDGEYLRQIEPRLAHDTLFGALTEGNLTVDGYQFTRSLAEGAARLGCVILEDAATEVLTAGERATGIRTSHELVVCDELILATGPWVAQTRSWLGIDVAVEPVKGEILLMRLSGRHPPPYDLTWGETSIYRRRDGEVWIGATMNNCGFDTTPTTDAKEFLLARASRMMPEIGRASLLAHWAALRPMSMSNGPIASRAPHWENVYIANGGGAKGLLFSVGIARAIHDLLVHGDFAGAPCETT